MNVFELDGTSFVFGSSWGIPDLSANFGSATQVTLSPNTIGDPDPFWYIGGGGPGQLGNKSMEANLYGEVADGSLAGQTLTFEGNVSAFSLTPAHVAQVFIRDFAAGFGSSVDTFVPITSAGAFSIDQALINDPTRVIQYGIQMKGENVWVTDVAPFGSVTVDAIPEPATLGLIGLFGGGLLFFRRRFKK